MIWWRLERQQGTDHISSRLMLVRGGCWVSLILLLETIDAPRKDFTDLFPLFTHYQNHHSRVVQDLGLKELFVHLTIN